MISMGEMTSFAAKWRPGVRIVLAVLTLIAVAHGVWAEEKSSSAETYAGEDTLSSLQDDNPDAQVCLEGLAWKPEPFTVTSTPADDGAQYDWLVQFPTPVVSGDKLNDTVAMEWYAPRDDDGKIVEAPAVLVVHESGSAMIVGRLFARSLQTEGFHAFLIHLPHYGKRRRGVRRPHVEKLVTTIQQAVADVRRGRDAIAALPHVNKQHIGIQGTSLGGFVVATSASLDTAFDSVFVVLAGGSLFDVIKSGQKDAAKVRQLLADAGYTDEKLKALCHTIEPTRLAHRLDPKMTWIYSAEHDQVVPLRSAIALAEKAGLDPSHHVKVLGNHYTAISHFPLILRQMTAEIRSASMSAE